MQELAEVLAAVRFCVKRGNRDEALEHLDRADVLISGAQPTTPVAAPVAEPAAEPTAPPAA